MDQNPERSVGKEIATAFAASAASIVGAAVGLAVVGLAIDQIEKFKDRKSKKEEEE